MERIRILRYVDVQYTPIIIKALEERFSAYDFDSQDGVVWVTVDNKDRIEMIRAFAAGALYAVRIMKK